MKKRLLATALWFYSGWYAGAVVASFVGLAPAVGIVVGVVAAAFFGLDPLRLFWVPTSAARRDVAPSLPADAAVTRAS